MTLPASITLDDGAWTLRHGLGGPSVVVAERGETSVYGADLAAVRQTLADRPGSSKTRGAYAAHETALRSRPGMTATGRDRQPLHINKERSHAR